MKHPKVTIGVILYKNEMYLPYSLTSLANQDYPNLEILVRDQSPNGEAAEFVKHELSEALPKITLTEGENLKHCGGHNVLIGQMTGEYYFCVSNDMWYPPDFVSKVVAEMEKGEHFLYGSATCKLMFWDFQKLADGPEAAKTNIIDSCGIGITKGHKFYDRGQGEEDKGQYDKTRAIFGPSGALAVFRKKALDALKPEFFDELMHYKGDVDLAYRLQWAGFPSLFIPSVKVWHDRQVSDIKKRGKRAGWTRVDSFFGHQVVLLKNFSSEFSLGVRLRTWLRQVATKLYAILLERDLRKALKDVTVHLPKIKRKRASMKRKVKPNVIEKLMS